MITAQWHASFTVKDIERSIHFYRDILGLELVHTQRQDNPYSKMLVGYPDADLKVAMFGIPGQTHYPSNHILELIEYVSPPGEYVPPGTAHVRSAHIAWAVTNIHEYVLKLKQQGVRFKSDVVAIEAGKNKGGFAVYFWDPDDFTLELLQPPASNNMAVKGG